VRSSWPTSRLGGLRTCRLECQRRVPTAPVRRFDGVSRTTHRGNRNEQYRGNANARSGYGERRLDPSCCFYGRNQDLNFLTKYKNLTCLTPTSYRLPVDKTLVQPGSRAASSAVRAQAAHFAAMLNSVSARLGIVNLAHRHGQEGPSHRLASPPGKCEVLVAAFARDGAMSGQQERSAAVVRKYQHRRCWFGCDCLGAGDGTPS
jgi:hypothetical protein